CAGGPGASKKVGADRGAMGAEGRRANTSGCAIEINRPVNLAKALRALDRTNGLVREATDQEMLDAKAKVGAGGFGCEPASAASGAGGKELREEGGIAPGGRVGLGLTRPHVKDPPRHRGLPQHGSKDLRRCARQARRPPSYLCQPSGSGAQ